MALRSFPRRPLLLLVLLALALSALDAAAQREFAGIPWGTPPAEAAERIRAAGYQLRSAGPHGDLTFAGPDGAELLAVFDPRGLVFVEARWQEPAERLPARFERMADSMRAVLGAPDMANRDDYERSITWLGAERGGAGLVYSRGGGIPPLLSLTHWDPGYEEEVERREGPAEVVRPLDDTPPWAEVAGCSEGSALQPRGRTRTTDGAMDGGRSAPARPLARHARRAAPWLRGAGGRRSVCPGRNGTPRHPWRRGAGAADGTGLAPGPFHTAV